ncbi:hypothetical protein J3998_04935 [Thiomicrorhabdus sp. 6S2-11]|uniref:DUF5610 domain-containing protein n=1 Tax=Thiomicrorhabdus marina TaxID=2818442 RepID=A0ABS3Q3M0_9GAMM|nr:hypothetical protein [Thiomicrorhabdus marina]MBO1926914.1 hypothetical protein [Thiomicrorhabdus marina]
MSTPIANALTANGLLNRYLNPSQDNANPKAAENAANNFIKQNEDVAYTPSAMRAGSIMQSEQAFSYSESMSLQLTTKEGDKVSVDFRQLYAAYQSYKEMQYAEQNDEAPQGFSVYESREAVQMAAFEERFAMSIEGDLNEEELGAIFSVFEQVDQIANQFYGGNIEQALQSAVDMEIDFGQLQNVSLNLTQSATWVSRQQQAAMQEYGENSAEQQSAETAGVEQLPEYYQKWQAALESLNQFMEDSQTMWDELTGKVLAQRFPEQDSTSGWLERVKAFHQQFAEFAQDNNQTTADSDATENENSVKEPT